jgi:hypothetical protein
MKRCFVISRMEWWFRRDASLCSSVSSRTLSLVLIRNPLEVLDSARIVGIEPLDSEESRRILELMHQVEWHPIR